MENYQRVLGIGSWEVSEWDDSNISEMTYHGKPARHRFRVALTMVGPMQLELIQPVEGENIYSDFLREHGEGLHHVGHVKVDNSSEALVALEKAGLRCLQSGRVAGGQYAGVGFAYMDAVNTLGTIIELFETPEGASPP